MFMYFEVQGAGLYERMKYPIIIRSTGMMLLYSLIPTFATQRMPYKYLSSWICTMLTVRMVLAPSIGTALYSNVLQERQQHYITRYAQNVDMMHPEASASFTQTVQGMQYQGKASKKPLTWQPYLQKDVFKCKPLYQQSRKWQVGHYMRVCFA